MEKIKIHKIKSRDLPNKRDSHTESILTLRHLRSHFAQKISKPGITEDDKKLCADSIKAIDVAIKCIESVVLC